MKRHKILAGNFAGQLSGDSEVATIPSEGDQNDWGWPVETSHLQHRERAVLVRPISYTLTQLGGAEILADRNGTALLMNISSHGMLLVMEEAPINEQVMQVRVPTPTDVADTPTLVEVRWVRKMPFASYNNLYLVGLKFVI